MLSVFRIYHRPVHLSPAYGADTLCGQPWVAGEWALLTDAPATCAKCLKRAKEEGTP